MKRIPSLGFEIPMVEYLEGLDGKSMGNQREAIKGNIGKSPISEITVLQEILSLPSLYTRLTNYFLCIKKETLLRKMIHRTDFDIQTPSSLIWRISGTKIM